MQNRKLLGRTVLRQPGMRRGKPTLTELSFFVCGFLVIVVGWLADLLRVAHRIRRGSRRARRHLESRRSADRAHALLPDAIGARRAAQDRHARGAVDPVIHQTSPATSLASTVYSCSFMAAGFAEISRYESLITIFSLTFWRNRITDGKPF